MEFGWSGSDMKRGGEGRKINIGYINDQLTNSKEKEEKRREWEGWESKRHTSWTLDSFSNNLVIFPYSDTIDSIFSAVSFLIPLAMSGALIAPQQHTILLRRKTGSCAVTSGFFLFEPSEFQMSAWLRIGVVWYAQATTPNLTHLQYSHLMCTLKLHPHVKITLKNAYSFLLASLLSPHAQ